MESCQEESLEYAPDQQQYQQQTTVEERHPFLSPTTPVWGDRNVSEQSAEESNNDIGSFDHSVPNTSESRISTNDLMDGSSTNSSSSTTVYPHHLPENTTNNQSFSDFSQLPRKCKLCSFVAIDRREYVDHIITHFSFTKNSYVENYHLNEYIDDEELDDYECESLSKGKKKPKIPKPKICNKCEFMAKTKLGFWLHLRRHFIEDECSGFVCILCPFATMLKHHMTFHWFSAHDDFKGFMCTECQYTCVSKSMLTSHMKTHSEVYQYNCGSCTYKTKFCNAMKKHLKDTRHLAGTVLNPDGTPNPFATIDVYGNKRGPRRRQIEERTEQTEIIEDRPSTSGINLPALTVPTSTVSVSSSSISSITISDSSDSKTLMSPVRTSPVKISPAQTPTPVPSSNFLVKDVLAALKMYSENGANPSTNPSINPGTNEQILLTPNYLYAILCQMMISEMEARQNVDDKEREQVFNLLHSTGRYLFRSEHLDRTTDVNGNLSDNANAIDKPSTSTTINEPSTSMVIDEPSTSMTIDEPSTSRAIDESSTSTAIGESLMSTMPVLESQVEENGVPDEPLDLSMSTMTKMEGQLQFQEPIVRFSRRKRKCKAKKLKYLTENESDNENIKRIRTESPLPAPATASQSDLQRYETLNVTHNTNISNSFICNYCHIIFSSHIMYTVHMSFHSTKDHLVCALCDRKSPNIIAFFLHLIQKKHW